MYMYTHPKSEQTHHVCTLLHATFNTHTHTHTHTCMLIITKQTLLCHRCKITTTVIVKLPYNIRKCAKHIITRRISTFIVSKPFNESNQKLNKKISYTHAYM